MALDNLSSQRIQETYQRLVQTEGGNFATGDGTAISIVTANETASFAYSASISGAFAAPSESFSARISILEATEDHMHSGVVSGSIQIASEISGAFTDTSHSLQNRVSDLEVHDHSTFALKSAISGAFDIVSQSLQDRLSTTEVELNNTLISGSSQLATEISGAFTEVSNSLQDRLTTAETELNNTLISGSSQLATEISGAFKETSASIAANIATNVSNIATNVSNITSLTNVTSSYLLNTTDTLTGDLIITGKLIAEQYIVSSSVTLMTQSFSSGSTIFGDDTSDTHQFTGSVFISGSSIQLNGADLLPFTGTGISGSFFTTSESISSRVESLEGNGVFTSDKISGSFFAPSSSFSERVTDLEGNGVFTATGISGSFVAPSSSFSERVTDLEDTSANRTFNDITASGNISASGKILFSSSLNDSTGLKTLMYDTSTGQIYHTGSYGGGGGGGGTGAGFPFSGSAIITGSFVVSGSTSNEDATFFADVMPGKSDEYILGSSTKKWNSVFATNTFFGGIHEINLETIGISQLQTGTVLVSNAGQMVPCDVQGDPLVMGIVTSGSDYPVVMGAEPVLVDGPVYEGDYIITSNKLGFGKAVPPNQIFEQKLFGKIIAQSLETNLSGGPVKAMIRKM